MPPIVSVQKIFKVYSGRDLFSELSLTISNGERVAILGANGAGKSTLLKILAGLESPDEGLVTTRKGLRVQYVSQQDTFSPEATVYSALHSHARGEGHEQESKISIAMGSVGFSDKDSKVSELSGGFRKRLAIAQGLVADPDLLLLDEPTNHLDIESIEWLEELIQTLPCAVAFVSHDRYFVETVASRVLELDRRYPDGALTNEGSYSAFISFREEYLQQRQQYRDTLANKVRREVEWLRRGAKARTTKSKHRTEEAHRLIKELSSIRLDANRSDLQFSSNSKRSKDLLILENVAKSMGQRKLFSGIDLKLSPGSRLGVVGGNGSGKSTFLRILTKELEPDKGTVKSPHDVRVVFFDQNRQKLDQSLALERALMGDAKSIVFNGREYVTVAWAKRFLFAPEQLKLPVSKLSGGEQARVLIAQLMRQPADILVLDEPTNDLDIPTLEVLEESLAEFPGAVVLVTHDRYLLDRVSEQVLGLFGDGRAEIFASYLQWEMAKEGAGQATPQKTNQIESKGNADAPRASGKLTYAERIELGKMENKLLKAEDTVAKIQLLLSDPAISGDSKRLNEECDRLSKAQAEVEALYARWEELEKKGKAS